MRVVLDANIYISALIQPKGIPAQIIDRLLKESVFECVLSPAVLEEVRRVIRYPRIQKRLPSDPKKQELFLSSLSLISIWVPGQASHPIVEADSSDDIYLWAALESGASFIVSGDGHLLDLKTYGMIQIVTPRQFLDIIG